MKKLNNPLFSKEKLTQPQQLFICGGQASSSICESRTCDGCREDSLITVTDDTGKVTASKLYLN